ncbi:MAG TPA: aldehyde dehydrogenase [Acidimicrobiaceae bacterium]|nr:aldehyde dehydrogenase [Acidimicrobiaceae bacterium]
MLTAQSYPDGASPAEDAHAADPLPRSKAPFLVSIDGAAPGNPRIDPTSLAEDAVAVVARWLTAARAIETAAERRSSERMRAIIEDPAGVSFTMRFVDRVARHRRDALAAEQLAQLVVDAGLPGFLGRFDRFLLTLGGRLAPTFPRVVMPLARRRLRSLVGHLVVDAAPEPVHEHLAQRRANGYDLNVNLLGEAVLGEDEATRRFERTLALVEDPEVDYVSVKVSAIASQLNLWAFDETLSRVEDRLRLLYGRAASASTRSGRPTFVNLDMEEHRDFELTIRAFTDLLIEPGLRHLDAGIVLQAYLPDSFGALQRLTSWASARRDAGGGEIKIRLVKGANLAMERVDAAMHGWVQAPYATKEDVDANYKRCVDWALRPVHVGAVRIGLASHNLFDLAWAHLLAEARGVSDRIEFEMLQGMASAQARTVRDETGGLLLYTPIVGLDDFDVAVAYLFRRLEENVSDENFLRHLFTMRPGTPKFDEQADGFRRAVARRWEVADLPRRLVDPARRAKPMHGEGVFRNQSDIDPSLPSVRRRIRALGGRRPDSAHTRLTTATDGSDGIDAQIAMVRAAQPAWADLRGSGRRDVLRRVADELLDRHDELLVAMAHEASKTFAEAAPEVAEAVDFARWYAERAPELDRIEGASFEPLGVVAVVPPWNFPVAIPAGGVMAALAAGNGVVFKPAPETPRCAELVAEACWAAGVPADVLRFVRVPDDEMGRQLVTSVDGVILTGSYETAELFQCWKPSMRLFAETSGKNALVVTPQADLDLAAADLVFSAFGHQGQKCSAASLGILVGSVAEDERFLRQLVDATRSLQVGPAHDPGTVMAPLAVPPTGRLLDALTVLGEGESWLLEPRCLDPVEEGGDGRSWTPGIRIGVRPGSVFHRTEVFGPVLGLIAVEDLNEALQVQNSVDFGLTGGIHSLDPLEVARWLGAVEVGNAYVNRETTGAVVQRQPFGGWKRSSVGPGAKTGGPDYLLQLGTWMPTREFSEVDQAEALVSDEVWWDKHYGIDRDPVGLFCESNVHRYRPHPDLVVRIGPGAKAAEVERVLAASARCGVEPRISRATDEDDAEFARSLSAHRFGRVRAIGFLSEVVRRAASVHGVGVIDEAVTASGRLELRHHLREQAVSQTLHRFGNLVASGLSITKEDRYD